jgi:hypothetical protein
MLLGAKGATSRPALIPHQTFVSLCVDIEESDREYLTKAELPGEKRMLRGKDKKLR